MDIIILQKYIIFIQINVIIVCSMFLWFFTPTLQKDYKKYLYISLKKNCFSDFQNKNKK